MVLRNPGCLGDYDFERIAEYARKRFIEGISTVSLMAKAKSEREREEIALVCSLDIADDEIENLNLHCRHADKCKISNCRSLLRNLIKQYH